MFAVRVDEGGTDFILRIFNCCNADFRLVDISDDKIVVMQISGS